MPKLTVMVSRICEPYSNLLHEQMREQGIRVREHTRGIWAWLSHFGKANIVHLHWIEYHFIVRKPRWLTLAKCAFYLAFLLVVKAARGKRLVVTLHNLKPHASVFPRLEHRMFAMTLRLADGIILHNEYARQEAHRIYGADMNRMRVTPHGTLAGYYPNTVSRQSARDILGIPPDAFVVLAFGLMLPYKGISELLRSAESLLTHDTNLFLLLAGRCDDETLAGNLNAFSARFPQSCLVESKYIPDDEVQVFLNASDVGILPYRNVTTSGVLFLFTAFGKPVIAADLPPMRELLGDSGLFFPPGDATDMQRVIGEAAGGSYDLARLADGVRQIDRQHSWKDMAEDTIGFYEQLLQKEER